MRDYRRHSSLNLVSLQLNLNKIFNLRMAYSLFFEGDSAIQEPNAWRRHLS